ncbi:MAG: imidazole glycerol phosphate synthase subunit HisH [Nannocystaceae bacterium]
MISIVDYGLGNIRAFANAYKRLRLPFEVVSTADRLRAATKIILPGVGAFDEAMLRLRRSGMRAVLDELVVTKRVPVLGICVGMHLLGDSSDEGVAQGLGWVPGSVKRLEIERLSHRTHLPHMGWNQVRPRRRHELFRGVESVEGFYFLHSYHFRCAADEHVLADTQYGARFSCALNRGNVYGVQCHPEKSHGNGLQLLRNFGEIQ